MFPIVVHIELTQDDFYTDRYIVEASEYGLKAYPPLIAIKFPGDAPGMGHLATMLRIVRSDSGHDVGAVVYEIDGKEVLHILNT